MAHGNDAATFVGFGCDGPKGVKGPDENDITIRSHCSAQTNKAMYGR